MLEWPSSETERTFNRSAANGKNEPKVSDAAGWSNVRFWTGVACAPVKCEFP